MRTIEDSLDDTLECFLFENIEAFFGNIFDDTLGCSLTGIRALTVSLTGRSLGTKRNMINRQTQKKIQTTMNNAPLLDQQRLIGDFIFQEKISLAEYH